MANGDSNFPLNLVSSFNNSNDEEKVFIISKWCHNRNFDYIKLILIDTVNNYRDFKFLKSDTIQTPLMICAMKGYIEVFQLISQFFTIDWGINHCSYNNNSNGKSALHYAVSNSQTEFVEKLLFSGADPNFLDTDNRTPLHDAAVENYVTIVTVIECLLSYGCDPNREDNFGNTALLHVVEHDHIDSLVVLIKYRADLDLVYNHGTVTIIRYAISKKRGDIIKVLLKANCSVNGVFIDYNIVSPLKLSLQIKNYYVAACLILCGCDLRPVWTFFKVRIKRLLVSIKKKENIRLSINSMEDVVDNSDDSNHVSNLNKTDTDLLDWIIKQAIQPQCLKLICRTKIRKIFRESRVHKWRPHMSSNDLNNRGLLFNEIEPKLPVSIVDYLNFSFLDYQNPLQMIWD